MASVADDSPQHADTSPVIANLVVILGFVLLFTTFATESPWSWILGGILIVSGGLWAGLTGERGDDRTA